MTSLGRFVVACFDLLEAEGRTLKRESFRLGAGLLVLTAAMIVAVLAALLLGLAIYLSLAPTAGPAWAALATALYTLVLGGMLAWLGTRLGR